MNTVKFFASLGVIAGYNHNNHASTSLIETASNAWQKVAGEVFIETGTYIGTVITPSKTVYSADWGCPIGGEDTVLITGECNPTYTEVDKYKITVLEVLKRTAQLLGQSTFQISFQDVEFFYVDFRKEEK